MPTRTSKTGSELFIVDNSDTEWKVCKYLHDWCQLSSQIDIATGHFEIGSTPVLWSFRHSYLTYEDRAKILFPAGRELIQRRKLSPVGRESPLAAKRRPPGEEFQQGFSSQLSWSHYRAMMRV